MRNERVGKRVNDCGGGGAIQTNVEIAKQAAKARAG
jgi:hypothetical protein